MERWLSLEIRRTASPEGKAPGTRVMILVSKRLVRQASARNRIRRVLREAVRLDAGLSQDKAYFLKVVKRPASVNLRSAQAMLKELHA